jgi:hypothetical protein
MEGIPYSINPDDDFFLPDFDQNIHQLNDTYHWTSAELRWFIQSAWNMKFGHRKAHLF